MTNPYRQLVSDYAFLARHGRTLPLGGFKPLPRPDIRYDAPNVLIFSPHPDDECVTGALALRLMREARMKVINVAVTQGSQEARQAGRWKELENACDYLGFGLTSTGPHGLEKINPKTREQDKEAWSQAVKVIAGILAHYQPRAVLFPHEQDWNSTHIGTHFLLMDALAAMPVEFACHVVETQFWGQMNDPNLMVEISAEDLGDLIAALSFHVGEVKRNPYHAMLPAWMQDNLLRGAEWVGGQGGAAPTDWSFAALYRLRRWSQGRLGKVFEGGKLLSRTVNPETLFA